MADLPLPERVERLRRPEVRAAILSETRDDAGAAASIADAGGATCSPGVTRADDEPARTQQCRAARAERAGWSPAEVGDHPVRRARWAGALLDMPLRGYADGDFRVLAELLTQPDVVLGLEHGGAHCGLLCDASVPTYMLSDWAVKLPPGWAAAAGASRQPGDAVDGGVVRGSRTGLLWRPATSPTST